MKKNSKIIRKRLIIKPKKKMVLRKKTHQSHYNASDSGDESRKKRNFAKLNRDLSKKIINLTS
ncbi:MAG: hypothetical protein GF335_00920 [Candidatus Moranbacteria bacterium]|nr:hypothetical protein [Candidatus Moranbacteria bacterium]